VNGEGVGSEWRGANPCSSWVLRVHISTHQSLLYCTLNPAIHFNGSNGTAYNRASNGPKHLLLQKIFSKLWKTSDYWQPTSDLVQRAVQSCGKCILVLPSGKKCRKKTLYNRIANANTGHYPTVALLLTLGIQPGIVVFFCFLIHLEKLSFSKGALYHSSGAVS
jgi:hypothetical protein